MAIIESANGGGARLAEARSEQGLSVEDLSSRTYIRPAVIRGIENDDFGPCGGPLYASGPIRPPPPPLGGGRRPPRGLVVRPARPPGAPLPRRAPVGGALPPPLRACPRAGVVEW